MRSAVKRKRERSSSSSASSDASDNHRSPVRSSRKKSSELMHRDHTQLKLAVRGNLNVEHAYRTVNKGMSSLEAWAALLTEIEKLQQPQDAFRDAVVEVLTKWPYCYGYWCKWGAMEAKRGEYEKAIEIYEEALTAFPISVDIWMAYLKFMRVHLGKREDGVEGIRRLQARALATMGLEWRSDAVWLDVLAFELDQKDYLAATVILDRLISTPTARLDENWERLKQHIMRHPVDDVVGQSEKEELSTIESEVAQRRAMIEKREKLYRQTKDRTMGMAEYEGKIKRPYFHTRPLERGQLENWMKYIEWVMNSEVRVDSITIIFERALVACALYEEFWLKYTTWMEKNGKIAETRVIFQRAQEIHCPSSVLVALAYSAFEEAQGSMHQAERILDDFEDRQPGHLLIQTRRLGVARRMTKGKDSRRCMNEVVNMFESTLQKTKKKERRSKELPQTSFVIGRYARFLLKVKEDRQEAENVLRRGIREDPSNENLRLQLVDLAYSQTPIKEDEVTEALDESIQSMDLPLAARIRFSQRKLDFLEELGSDIKKIQEHVLFHTRLLVLDTTPSRGPKPVSVLGSA